MYLTYKHMKWKMKLGHFTSVTSPNIFFKSRRVCQECPLKHRNPRILKAANLLNPTSKRISMVSTLYPVSCNNRIFIPTQYLLLKPCGKLKPEQDLLREQQMKLREYKRWYKSKDATLTPHPELVLVHSAGWHFLTLLQAEGSSTGEEQHGLLSLLYNIWK